MYRFHHPCSKFQGGSKFKFTRILVDLSLILIENRCRLFGNTGRRGLLAFENLSSLIIMCISNENSRLAIKSVFRVRPLESRIAY